MTPRYPAKRIVIRCPNWVGDMVAATAFLRCARENYPDAHLALLLRPYVRPVVENAPWADEIILFQRGAVRRLRKNRFDLAILLTHSFRTALTVRLGGARRRVGYSRGDVSWLLTDPIPWPRENGKRIIIPKVKLYSSIARYLNLDNADDQRPELFTSDIEEQQAATLLQQHGRDESRPLIGLVPGARYGSSKLWPPERFAAVADALAERRNAQLIVFTGPGEGAIGADIEKAMKTPLIRFAENTTTLGHLKAFIRDCALVICNDTGPRHFAIAYQTPTVVIMGPTDPRVTHSDYAQTRIVQVPVECGPCYKRICPRDHRCMTAITPEMVLNAAEDLT